MKKMTSAILSLLFCFFCLAGCVRAEELPLDYPVDTSFTGSFVGECNGPDVGDTVSVTVRSSYQKKLGRVVNVKMDGLSELNLNYGNNIKVEIVSIEATVPPTVIASSVRVTAKGNDGWDRSGYGPYMVYELSELSVPDDFPDIPDEEHRREMTPCEGSSWEEYFRVVEVRGPRVYLSFLDLKIAYWVLDGVPEGTVSAGDHIAIKYLEFYCIDSYRAIYFCDVTKLRVLSGSEIERAHQWVHMFL